MWSLIFNHILHFLFDSGHFITFKVLASKSISLPTRTKKLGHFLCLLGFWAEFTFLSSVLIGTKKSCIVQSRNHENEIPSGNPVCLWSVGIFRYAGMKILWKNIAYFSRWRLTVRRNNLFQLIPCPGIIQEFRKFKQKFRKGSFWFALFSTLLFYLLDNFFL